MTQRAASEPSPGAPGPRRAAAAKRPPAAPGRASATDGPSAPGRRRSLPSASALESAHQHALDVASLAAFAAEEKKAERAVVLDVGDLLAITDAMVICSASNSRLVRTIADEVELAVRAAGEGGPVAVEGLEDASWVLLDYGAFVVHVFLEDVRAYYDLERLWSEAPRVDWRQRSRR